MKEILKSIIVNIVDNEDAVKIEEKVNGENVIYEITVAQSDMGLVIGRQGRVARSIRTLMKSLGYKNKKKVIIEFMNK